MNIFEIFGIDEAYQLTDKLAEILFNREARQRVFAEYISTKPDLSRETFLEAFQSGHADRERLNQDFTPPAVAELVSLLSCSSGSVLDVCAGTGSLTIAYCQVGAKSTCPNRVRRVQPPGLNAVAV